MQYFIRIALASTLAVLVLVGSAPARALDFIRDAEIEETIRTMGGPLFAMAGLTPGSVRVYIVNDSSLNAFVAGGQNIFVNTGLILATDNPNQLIGVIAHETGHITGGHLARTHDALRDASAQTILSFVLGAAAVIAGQGQAAGAIVTGGATAAQRSFLTYSRVQEASADQAALQFLDATGHSARGLAEFFEKLGDQEALLTANQDPYVRTHPLTRERVEAVRSHIARSPVSDKPEAPETVLAHARMKAKLAAFLQSPVQTFRQYPREDTSLPARYAHAIAFHRQRDAQQALATIDRLIAESPDDPYFHELKGQFLLENGDPDAAIAPYAEAVRLRPNQVLLRLGLGQAQVSAKTDAHLNDALANLQRAVQMAPRDAGGWRWLAMAYGRKGDVAQASLATAERYILLGRYRDAIGQADRAERLLPAGSPAQLRAQDIKQAAERALKNGGNQ